MSTPIQDVARMLYIHSIDGRKNRFEGRVEVCQDPQWKTVCNTEWGDKEAQVVCR
jgi:hypothetical protein